jgi:hypothetical protein
LQFGEGLYSSLDRMTSLKGRTLFITGAPHGNCLTGSLDSTGHFLLNRDVLSSQCVTDHDRYNYIPLVDLQPGLFLSQAP